VAGTQALAVQLCTVPHVRRDGWQQIRKAHASGKSRPFGGTHEASGCDLDSPGTRFHDGQMATSITGLIERFYGELWNKWNDSAVDDTLSPDFTFRGSLGRETSGRQGWRQYRDLVHAGSADFRNEIVELVCEGERAAVRLRYTGTHTGLLLGCLPRSGVSNTRVRPSSPQIIDGSPAPGSSAISTGCGLSSVDEHVGRPTGFTCR
jgi:SnoaL-like polyketide cyclase